MTDESTINEMRRRQMREERELIKQALIKNNWSLTGAAMELGIPLSTLQYMIGRHGMSPAYKRNAQRPGRPAKG